MDIKITTEEGFEEKLRWNLHQYSREKCPYIKEHSDLDHNDQEIINLAVRDEQNNLIAGAHGLLRFAWYYLDFLWVKESYRNKGIGKQIMQELERIARQKNGMGMRVDTAKFQAKEFYEKQGYEVFAELKDFPPGDVQYQLKKML